MSLAIELQAEKLIAHSDSQLVVQQFRGEYEAREPVMAQYLKKVKSLAARFTIFELVQINRLENNHADALSKLASYREAKSRMVKIEVLKKPTIEEEETLVLEVGERAADWRTPIQKYLLTGELPSNPTEAKKKKLECVEQDSL